MSSEERIVVRCEIGNQPTTEDYQFELSFFESGEKVKLDFCGSICLREWINTRLDEIHLNTLESIE
jgi:hypothetical protein